MSRSAGIFLLGIGATLLIAPVACTSLLGVQDVTERKSRDGGATSSGDPPPGGDNPPPGPGVVPPPPKIDAGKPVSETGCNGQVACPRLVFVTHNAFTGNLGGIAGANQKCTAAGQKISGFEQVVFRAWLSDGSSDARDSLVHGTMGYRRVDGTTIASSFDDLVDGMLSVPVSLDETGTRLAQAGQAWTGTHIDGTKATETDFCVNWTNEIGDATTGGTGNPESTVSDWTSDTVEPASASCNSSMHLYCIEF